MPFPEYRSDRLSIGPLAIHWYGLAYVAGIMLGWYYARVLAGNDTLWPGNPSPIRNAARRLHRLGGGSASSAAAASATSCSTICKA
jgi:hypothetical protein